MSKSELEAKKETLLGIYENLIKLFNPRNTWERELTVKARHIIYNLNMLKGKELELYILELNKSVWLLLNQAERKTA